MTVIIRERIFGFSGYLIGYLLSAVVMLAEGEAALSRAAYRWTTVAISIVIVVVPVGLVIAPRIVGSLEARVTGRLTRTLLVLGRGFDLGSVKDIVVCAALSLAAWLCWVGAVLSLSRGLDVELPWSVLAAIATVSELIRFIPISFQGIGLREASFALLVGAAGGSQSSRFPRLGWLLIFS